MSCPLRQVQTSKACERTNNQVKACCFITNNAGGNMSTHLNMKIGTPRMLIGNFERHSSFLVLLTQMTLRLISTRHYDWSSPHRIKLYPRQDVWRLIQRWILIDQKLNRWDTTTLVYKNDLQHSNQKGQITLRVRLTRKKFMLESENERKWSKRKESEKNIYFLLLVWLHWKVP